VIHYNKIVKLQTGRLREGHPDMESITEILRIKVDPWMREMDDPVSTMRTLRGDSIVRVTTRRVYHAHLILVMTQAGVTERRRFQHHLLVLSREGVVRIEPVAPQGGVRREPAAPQDIAESSRE
jgi:hypothetical protein